MITSTAPFKPDQAVCYIPYVGLNVPMIIRPGVVLSTTEKRVRIRLGDQHPMHVEARYICYRGYCEACRLPAIEDAGHLICPRCEQPAVDAIPPDRILFDQHGELPTNARCARDVLAGKGVTYEDCHPRDKDAKAWSDMLERTGFGYSWSKNRETFSYREKDRLHAFAVLGDEAVFIAEYRRLVAAYGLKDPIKEYKDYQLANRLYLRIIKLVDSGAFDGLDVDGLEPAELLSPPCQPGRMVCIDIAA